MDRAIALGFFDGLHLGHQALLERVARRASERGLTPALFSLAYLSVTTLCKSFALYSSTA